MENKNSTSQKGLISIIIPVYNEEKNIPLIYDELIKIFRSLQNKYNYEIIFINDGSSDNSFIELTMLAKKDDGVKLIDFTRNFGHQNAVEAGLAYAKGSAVIMMDADLQHPPQLIPVMIEKWEQGNKIVNTLRLKTEKESIIKKITSSGFYWFFNKISTIKMSKGFADFRLLDREVVDVLNSLPEKRKFYRGLVNWVGHKNTNVEYSAQKRINGNSSFTIKKMIDLAYTGITSFSTKPMWLIFSLGAIVSTTSFLFLLLMVFVRYFISFSYFSPLSFIVIFIVFNTGIIFISQGIIGLYLTSIYEEIQDRPNYIIRKKINL